MIAMILIVALFGVMLYALRRLSSYTDHVRLRGRVKHVSQRVDHAITAAFTFVVVSFTGTIRQARDAVVS